MAAQASRDAISAQKRQTEDRLQAEARKIEFLRLTEADRDVPLQKRKAEERLRYEEQKLVFLRASVANAAGVATKMVRGPPGWGPQWPAPSG